MTQTLIVSDLHLHCGSDASLAGDFARLLESSKANTLVINGDLFNLDYVDGETRAGKGKNAARNRLIKILDKFPRLLEALIFWGRQGREIVIIPGNHDAEIWHPELQQQLRTRLNLGQHQLQFCDSYKADDTLVVEHGHQYDPDNYFHPNTATAVAKNRLSAMPLGCLIARFLLCRIAGYSMVGDNHQVPLAVLISIFKRHRWSTPKLVLMYIFSALPLPTRHAGPGNLVMLLTIKMPPCLDISGS